MAARAGALLLATALSLGAEGAIGGQQDQRSETRAAPEEGLLQQAGVAVDDKGLLSFFEKRSASDADLKHLPKLIGKLASDDPQEREAATIRIRRVGLAALEALRERMKGKDLEVAKAARTLAEEIDREFDPFVNVTAVRLLCRQNPPGAIAALLRFLPYAAEEELQEEVWFALAQMPATQRELSKAYQEAARDPLPLRRALAGLLLARRGSEADRKVARGLLADPSPEVRLRTAQGFLAAKEKEAIPTLIDLLQASPVSVAWQAEELLHWAAGENAVAQKIGAGTAVERKTSQKAWQAWSRDKGRKLDLAGEDHTQRRPGLMIVSGGGARQEGVVGLYGCDGKPRWEIKGLGDPYDARLLPGDRILIADNTRGLSERDLRGAARWKYSEDIGSFVCRRLPSGNIFIGGLRNCAELSPDGERLSLRESNKVGIPPGAFNNGMLECPQWRPKGHVVYQTRMAAGFFALLEIGPDARFVKSVNLFREPFGSGGFRHRVEALANGHYLFAGFPDFRVREVDGKGRTVWKSASLGQFANHAVRLPTGNTLVAAWPGIVEVEPDGKVIWEGYANLVRDPPLGVNAVRPCLNLVRLGFDAPWPKDFDLATSVPYRVKQLASRDPRVRKAAVLALEKLAPKAASAVPALLELCDEQNKEMRRLADNALEQAVGPEGSPVLECLPVLLGATKDKRAKVRAAAVRHLWKYSKEGTTVAPVLLQGMKDEDPRVRRAAVSTCRAFPDHGKELIPALVKALQDPEKGSPGEGRVAERALSTLPQFGSQARIALPAVINLLREADEQLRGNVIQSMRHFAIRDKEVIQILRKLLTSEQSYKVRVAVAQTLGALESRAEGAVRDLLAVLQLERKKAKADAKELCGSIVSSLGSIGPAASQAAPALRELAEGSDRTLRDLASEALNKIQRPKP